MTFKKVNKIDKPLSRFIKKKRRTQINKIKNEKGEVTTDTLEIQVIRGDYCEQLCTNKMDSSEEMGELTGSVTYSLPGLTQEEVDQADYR